MDLPPALMFFYILIAVAVAAAFFSLPARYQVLVGAIALALWVFF